MDTYDEALGWAREVCLALLEAFEEPAWVGMRWKIRAGTFAHVLEIVDGYRLRAPRKLARLLDS